MFKQLQNTFKIMNFPLITLINGIFTQNSGLIAFGFDFKPYNDKELNLERSLWIFTSRIIIHLFEKFNTKKLLKKIINKEE